MNVAPILLGWCKSNCDNCTNLIRTSIDTILKKNQDKSQFLVLKSWRFRGFRKVKQLPYGRSR